jgi:4-hydroxyphenylacetate 3-monooxygenase
VIRTGAQYIESLRDARTVFVDGERVADVTEHMAFRAAVRSIAHLYDLAAAHREVMTFPSPATGHPVNACFLKPRTPADLAARRRAHRLWAEATYGLMGRSPDHVPGFITGFALCPELFARGGARFGDHVARYHAYLRDHDLYASYVIIPPIVDRSRPAHQQDDPTVYAGVVEERPDGIVVSGAQMLGTGAAISNEVFVSCISPLQPGDENYALSFAVPAAAPGLRMIVRRPYAQGLPAILALRRDGRRGDLRSGVRSLGAGIRLSGRGPDAGAVL